MQEHKVLKQRQPKREKVQPTKREAAKEQEEDEEGEEASNKESPQYRAFAHFESHVSPPC